MWFLAGCLRVLSSLLIAAGLGLGTYLFLALEVRFLVSDTEVTPAGMVITFAGPFAVAGSFVWFHRSFWAGAGAALLGHFVAGQGLRWVWLGLEGAGHAPHVSPLHLLVGLVTIVCGAAIVSGSLLSLVAGRLAQPATTHSPMP